MVFGCDNSLKLRELIPNSELLMPRSYSIHCILNMSVFLKRHGKKQAEFIGLPVMSVILSHSIVSVCTTLSSVGFAFIESAMADIVSCAVRLGISVASMMAGTVFIPVSMK